jgi:glycosyltransferase involved in cell wall biosynthesis
VNRQENRHKVEVFIIQRIFAKYRKDIFDELHKHIDFLLLHSVNKSGISQVTSDYSRRICSIKYSRKATKVILNVFPSILIKKPRVIIHEFSIGIASIIPTFILTRLLGIKFILWGHGYDRSIGFHPGNSINDKVRLFMIRRSDAVILYGKAARNELSEFVTDQKLFVASNCLNTKVLNEIRGRLEKEGIGSVKKRIGFNYKYNITMIGRLLRYKQPQLLLDIYDSLSGTFGDTLCIHFVGDGESLEELKLQVKERHIEKNVVFHGAIYDDLKNGELLYCSDLMIMPGPVGLSVNHAFNFDCPVITYKQDGHGPEIEYLINNDTGFVVTDYTVGAMALVIDKYLKDQDLQEKMKKNIRNIVENTCSINNFIKGFEEAINYVQSKKVS